MTRARGLVRSRKASRTRSGRALFTTVMPMDRQAKTSKMIASARLPRIRQTTPPPGSSASSSASIGSFSTLNTLRAHDLPLVWASSLGPSAASLRAASA